MPEDLRFAVTDHVGVLTLARPEARNALRRQTYRELEEIVRGLGEAGRALPRHHRRGSGVLLRRRREADHGRPRATDGTARHRPAPDPGGGRAAPHRRPGRRRGQRRGRRLGHGAGADGRHPGGVGAGPVRRAVRAARTGLGCARPRAAGPARRAGAGRGAALHRRDHRRRDGVADRAGVAGGRPRRPARRGDRASPGGSPPTRRSRCRHSRTDCAGPSIPDWHELGAWVSSELARLFQTDDHREGVASFLEKRPPSYTGHGESSPRGTRRSCPGGASPSARRTIATSATLPRSLRCSPSAPTSESSWRVRSAHSTTCTLSRSAASGAARS